jgi:predicted type IV restriction endonuclease
MSLEADIQDIQNGLKIGRYGNEASVSQGIILRLLNRLGWQIFDSTHVWPEYALGGGRVDYALCCPPSRPVILIESKDVGLAFGAERQLFEYAFHQGIPMAILTDGQEWSFFLPGEQGAYHERCVYKLDLIARPVGESTRIFERYLKHEEVASGRALENAKSDYRTVSRTRQIKDALPVAWQQILRDQDELLVDLIAERVATICGFKPEPEVVADFIQKVTTTPTPPPPAVAQQTITAIRPPATPLAVHVPPAEPQFSGFALDGQRYNEGSAIDTLMRVFEVLSARDPNFLERYAALPKHGRKRRYLSRKKLELYPGRPDLCEEYSVSRFGGWWIGTNYSRSTIRHAIELACQVARLQFGTDLKLI